ncbi:S-layer homology domain-containing protein [Paenibacillus gyeongsangnamensis]|uniref:S-layer homology domain-containing protein n=1 Tax=Paenibacillus gyeongsangnamensis TaxID=3388067 RepID=UPI0039083B55
MLRPYPRSLAAPASDLSKHWAKDQIGAWTALDLAEGYLDGTFKPDSSITRTEFMALVNRVFNYTAKAEINFKDVAALGSGKQGSFLDGS